MNTLPPRLVEKFVKLDALLRQLDPGAQAMVLARLDAHLASVRARYRASGAAVARIKRGTARGSQPRRPRD